MVSRQAIAAATARGNPNSEVDVSSPANMPHRILCVDDRVSSLEVRQAMLTQMGYNVLIASDPASALSIFDKVHIDLVLLDYSFPGNIPGDELARQLRSRRPDLPLIMLSGFPELPPEAAKSVDVLLLKGASQPSDLLNAIAKLLPTGGNADGRPAVDNSPLAQQNKELLAKSRDLVKRSQSQMRRTTPDAGE